MLKGKKIILGITGSIAAYKACYIIRGLIRQGAEVQVVITPAGKEFITPITLSALTSKPVISEFFAQRDGTWNSHVDLGLWADAMLIAPATASTIGKMANGIADNMLITTYLSAKAPVFVAPAMDLDMYAHPATQKNLEILRSYGNYIIEPGTGELASHLVGKGRMEEPENIIRVLDEFFSANGELQDKKIKREKEEELTLHLQATEDIAASLGALKGKNQLLVGFALETNNEQQNAEGKLERKNFDFIVLNSLNDAGAGFRYDTNKISIIDRKGRTDYPLKSKTEVAQDIIDRLSDELKLLTLNP